MAINKKAGYLSGADAAYIKPKLIPDAELLGRDDSGGIDYQPYSAQWGDGEFKQGEKPHLSTGSGKEDRIEGDEISQDQRDEVYFNNFKDNKANRKDVPAKSKALAKE